MFYEEYHCVRTLLHVLKDNRKSCTSNYYFIEHIETFPIDFGSSFQAVKATLYRQY